MIITKLTIHQTLKVTCIAQQDKILKELLRFYLNIKKVLRVIIYKPQ